MQPLPVPDPRNADLQVYVNGRLVHRDHAAVSPWGCLPLPPTYDGGVWRPQVAAGEGEACWKMGYSPQSMRVLLYGLNEMGHSQSSRGAEIVLLPF